MEYIAAAGFAIIIVMFGIFMWTHRVPLPVTQTDSRPPDAIQAQELGARYDSAGHNEPPDIPAGSVVQSGYTKSYTDSHGRTSTVRKNVWGPPVMPPMNNGNVIVSAPTATVQPQPLTARNSASGVGTPSNAESLSTSTKELLEAWKEERDKRLLAEEQLAAASKK